MIYGKLELVKVKNVHTDKYSVDSFTRKRKLFVDETSWFINDKPYTTKQKLSYLKKYYAPCFFERLKISTTRAALPSNTRFFS